MPDWLPQDLGTYAALIAVVGVALTAIRWVVRVASDVRARISELAARLDRIDTALSEQFSTWPGATLTRDLIVEGPDGKPVVLPGGSAFEIRGMDETVALVRQKGGGAAVYPVPAHLLEMDGRTD